MSKISLETYQSAIQNWENALQDVEYLASILKPTHIFLLNAEEITEFNILDDSADHNFRVDMGILEDQVILVLIPRDEHNEPKNLENYTYVALEELTDIVELKQFISYTKKVITLSNDLSVVDEKTEFAVAELSKPALPIDQATEEIVAWKNEALDWINQQSTSSQCANVFRHFFMPKESIIIPNRTIESVILFLGLRQNETEESKQSTMIVLSQHTPVLDWDTEFSYTSNTLNFSKPCPPN